MNDLITRIEAYLADDNYDHQIVPDALLREALDRLKFLSAWAS